MTHALFLIDTSGVFRILQRDTRSAWADHLAAGTIAVCPVVELEFLYSARSRADREDKQRLVRELFSWVPMPDDAWMRAAEVQQLLTDRGWHRSAGAIDLLIAATAERHGLSLLADDRDFVTISRVTRQPVRAVVA
ncbi:MAG: PIN domain nuclease [Mobilicoccus sp.]|nr:PIN domain nuclease [Mobilicoccus sp.]